MYLNNHDSIIFYLYCYDFQREMDITEFKEKNNKNFKLFSKIPEICIKEPCVLGKNMYKILSLQ